jgi:hypothetical protein
MPSTFIRSVSEFVTMSAFERPPWKRGFVEDGTGICRTGRLLASWWFTFVGLLFFAASATAGTPVSGAIAVNTRWTVADSPYLLSGDVVVQNGAVLTLDPGVTIYMGANAGLTVQAGGIQALGTAANPIRVLSDKTRLGQTAALGDWKQWVFNPGTVNTRLDHVLFEHGSGLAVKGSAPVLNYLTLSNHQGAAITVDLAASPTGVGNQASGNAVNGIAVPAGDIIGSVKWGLRGIPYVVASGVVSVGASPTVVSITPNTIQQGETATIDITGSRLNGLADVRFDNTKLTAQLLPGATGAQASFSVMADGSATIGATAMRLQVDAGEIRMADAFTVLQPQPTLTGLNPSTLYQGQGTVDVVANGRNFTSQAAVLVNGAAVTTQFQSATQLSASINAPAAAGNLPVRVRTPDPLNAGQYLTSNELALSVVPAQLVLNPATVSVAKGFAKTFTLTLPYPAPTGGLTFNLVSSVPTVATVPATLTVPEGQTSASFQLSATDVGSTVVTASKSGFIGGQSLITVVPPPTLTLTPAQLTLGVGRTAELTIQSSVPAGASGLTITLSSSNSAVATVPASATISVGASSVTVPVTTVAIGTATIQAQATEFAAGTAAVTVRPVSLNLPSGALVAPSLSRSIPITLSDPAPAGGLVVTLASSNSAAVTVPASITVPEGQTSANFTLAGVAVGTATVSATATGYQSASLPVTVEAVTIGIGNPPVSLISIPADISQTYAITLSKPAPVGGVVINLTIADPTKATVSPSSITILEGQTSGGTVLVTVTGVAKGTTTLSASAEGLSPANVNVTVTKPALVFSKSTVTVGKGLKNYSSEVYVYRQADGSNYSPNQALTVYLSSSDSSKASVPATVTIPAGSYFKYFQVTGVDFTNGTPVTIDATATGYSAPATKLATSVVAPVLNLNGLAGTRSVGSARDDFRVYVTVPGAVNPNSQTAAADLPIDLAIVNDSPAGLVDGFYSASTGGVPITQVLLSKDSTYSNYAYIGTPTEAGSYQVQASAADAVTALSGAQTVSPPELQFSRASVIVGKGLKNYASEVYVSRAVNGNPFNGAAPLTVYLTSSDPSKVSVPTSVTIQANSSSGYFQVTGVDFTNGTPVTIDATATGYSAPATKLATSVVAPVLNLNGLAGTRSVGSARDDFRVYVTVPGAVNPNSQTAAADLPIDLAIVNDSPAGLVDGFYSASTGGVPITQVLLSKDSTYSNYAYIGTPTEAGSYQVQASAADAVTALSGAQTVSPPELRFSRPSVTVGKGLKNYVSEIYVYRAVSGNQFNGATDVTVNLACSSTAVCNVVPASVTIPAGSYYAYFQVIGVDLGNTTVTASATGYNPPVQDLPVSVVTPQLNFSGPSSTTTVDGQSNFRVYPTVSGASYSSNQTAISPITVNLTSSAPGVATVPSTVTIQVGNTYSDYAALTGVAPGTTTLTASSPGMNSVTSGTITINPNP